MSEIVAERYRLLGPLGQGGMGRVWAARDELLDRDVALKELVPPPGLSPAAIGELHERAIREARAIARIDHPNVVRIYDVVRSAGAPWIVMELVPSRTLHEAISQDGPIAPERVARIGLDVLAGLRAAHRSGVLHRDVKPANVLLGLDGRVVLTDFGLAYSAGDSAMTSEGIVVGSPSYLAPERALDGRIGPAADLWSLGATLFAAVEGRPPYERSTPVATLTALATEPPPAPELAGRLRPALDALLRKDPATRADAADAERLLREAAAPAVGPASAPAVAPAPAPAGDAPPARRRRWWIGLAAVLIVAAGIAARPVLTAALAEEVSPPERGQPLVLISVSPAAVPANPAASASPTQVTRTSQQASGSAGSTRPATPTATTSPVPAATRTATTAAAVGRPIENMQTGTCLRLDQTTNAIQLWGCDGGDAQRFSFPADGTLRVLGRCVRIQGTGDGSRLAAAACSGAADRQFRYNAAYDLVSVQVDKCVDVPDGNSSAGVPAQIWSCTGNGNQKWKY